MPLIPSNVPVRFGGQNSKTDPRWLVPGDLVLARNVVFDKWPKIQKRPGTKKIATTTALTGAQLSAFKDQLLLGSGSEAFGYATSGLVDKGALESMTPSVRAVRRDAYAQTTPDSAVHPFGITVYTWETSAGGSQYSIFNTATGQAIVSGTSLGANAVKPKALTIGNYIVILFYDTALNHLRYVAIPASTPTAPIAVADFAVDPATTQIFDATTIGGAQGQIVVAYANNAGANKITLKALSAQLALGAATSPVTAEAFNTCVAIFGDASQNVWVAYYTGTAIKAFVYDSTLSNLLLTFTAVDAAPGTVRNITGIVPSGSTATVLYEVSGSASYNAQIKTATLTLAGAVSGLATLVRSVGLASKPFFYLGRVHFLAAYQSTLQSAYFLISGSGVVCKLAASLGGGLTAKSILPEVVNPSAGIYGTTYLQTDQLTSSGGNIFTQAGVMAGSFDFTAAQTAVELSDSLHLTGGILSMYDGQQVCEHGFLLYPENLTFTAGGSGAISGTYQACAVYEWMDAQGLVHQSSPSPVVSVTASSNAFFDYTVQSLRLTNRSTAVSVVYYRTLANGTVFFRVSSISSPNINSTTADTVSAPLHGDTLADTSLTGNAQLIFNPDNTLSELPPLAAPAPLHVWRYRNRIALIPAENGFQWVYSKALVPGAPIEFNDQNLFQAVSQDGGALTCGIEMDEKNILFTSTRIYYVVGDGPAPNGTGSDYAASPQNIPSDVGCINRRSLVLTPMGVMFQSAKGIYLLGRDLSVSYVGAPVEPHNGLTITRALLVPNSRRAIFFTNGGTTMVYDYYAEKWAVWTNEDAVDAAVFAGNVHFLKANGKLMQETPGVFNDDGAPILQKLTTSILSFAGLSGFQRVYRLSIRGDYRSAHRLTVSVAYDDNPAPLQVRTVDAGSLLGAAPVADTTLGGTENPGGGAYAAYEFVEKCKQQKCSSVQITIEESQAGPTYGEGYSLSGITFLVGGLKGLHPVAATRVA